MEDQNNQLKGKIPQRKKKQPVKQQNADGLPNIENPQEDKGPDEFLNQIEIIHQIKDKERKKKCNELIPKKEQENKPNIDILQGDEDKKFMDRIENIRKKPIKKEKPKEEEKKICNGFTATRNNCTRAATNNTIYCDSHQYFDTFTESEIVSIKSGKVQTCRKCKKYKFDETKTCVSCLTDQSDKSAITRANNPPSRDNKCIEIDRENNPCRNNKLDGMNYCKYHEYLNGVSPEERAKFTMCDRCKKYKNCNGKTNCEQCSSDLQQYQKNKQNDVICKGNLQTNKACSNHALTGEEFCGNHINYARVYKEAKNTNSKICSVFGHYKNCDKIIPITSPFNTCQSCRNFDNNYNRKK